jgi:hypothetical protein
MGVKQVLWEKRVPVGGRRINREGEGG